MRLFLAALVYLLIGMGGTASAQNYSLIDTGVITKKFESSMAMAKALLERFTPPRYMIYKVIVTFSITNGFDGAAEGKIPVGVASVGFKGDYEQIATKKQTFTYVPNTTIPTNVEDFGVLAFITQIQTKVSQDLKKAPFIVSRAEHEEEFMVAIDGEGKLSFLELASISGSANLKNSHKITFFFCLLNNEGNCSTVQ